jgi:hypothetical protein
MRWEECLFDCMRVEGDAILCNAINSTSCHFSFSLALHPFHDTCLSVCIIFSLPTACVNFTFD